MLPDSYNPPAITRGDSWSGLGTLQILEASGDPIPAVADADTDTLTAAGHGLLDDDIVRVTTTAGGLTAARRLYVVNADTDTLQLALDADGDPINLTSDATHSLQLQVPPASELAHVRIQFRLDSPTGPKGLELTDENGGVTIDDAAAWRFTVPAQAAPARAGDWHYDVETEDAAGTIRTYLAGILRVADDVTRVAVSA